MTIALCLSCGATKFGAFCPCTNCQTESTGNPELDIAFSDHHVAVSTLEQLGTVIKAINAVTDNDDERFWSFMKYVSENVSEILSVEIEADKEPVLTDILVKASPPKVTFEPGHSKGDEGGKMGCLTLAPLLIAPCLYLILA